MTVAHAWLPIEPPAHPEHLEAAELRGFAQVWERQRGHLRVTGADERFLERLRRSWAIETGIIERLYDLSEGATHLLVQQGLDASLISHGDTNLDPVQLVAMLRDHRESLDFAMDVIGGTRPLSTSWIKELHALLTRNQHSAKARTPDGRWIDVPLLKGEWKRLPNNPWSEVEGGTHEYCPPEQVASEMDRLIEIHANLPNTLPEVRSAWLHHAFTQIHPFQDGNGRVARVLASLDFIRAGLFPLRVRRTEKGSYIDALRAADGGDLKPLVRLFAELQQKIVMSALADAEAMAHEDLGSVLAAARAKRDARLQAGPGAAAVLLARKQTLATISQDVLTSRAEQVRAALPDIQVRTQAWEEERSAFWLGFVLAEHRQGRLWAFKPDQQFDPLGGELRLLAPDETKLSVLLLSVEGTDKEVFAAVALMEHQLPGASTRGPTNFAEPLLMTMTEDPTYQRQRFKDWLEQAIVQGLALWTQDL
jgi:Fic family protein